jgi:FtsP/CotA-like multicopper oxidase with cupredoxin domain
VCAALVFGLPSQRPDSSSSVRTSFEQISINDNRLPAGPVSRGVLTIRLEARLGEWHPDTDDGPGVILKAFGLEGAALQIPGPLIRVPEGTEIRALIRNRLVGEPLVVHGLYSRPATEAATPEVVSVPPGEAREVKFLAGRPGTYYYWGASTADIPLNERPGRESQLSGAFIVDSRDSDSTADRVLLISFWNNATPQSAPSARRYAINGKSWPNTERLNYRVDETVRIRLINAGVGPHPMHLHGFYFKVDSRGDEREDNIFTTSSSPRLVVTERLISGRTFSLTWKPTRPGNWLFHCHDSVHLEPGGALDGSQRSPLVAPHHVKNHALEMMAGPVMGVTVTGRSAEAPESPLPKRRELRLVARVRPGSTQTEPAYGYTLETGKAPSAIPPPAAPGPAIVLTRGEPVSLTVENQLPEPTSVHWHGIELESYYDGVAGYAGESGRIAPAILPGGTFEARFTPRRSGTFIYHTHVDEVRQLQAGLSGPLLVVDSLDAYDPERDFVMFVSAVQRPSDEGNVWLNGSSSPAPREMQVGQRYRLRFINIHTSRPGLRMRILRNATLLTWRARAKDGMDLPADQANDGPAEVQIGTGETYDFDFVPTAPGEIRIEVAAMRALATMLIRVR